EREREREREREKDKKSEKNLYHPFPSWVFAFCCVRVCVLHPEQSDKWARQRVAEWGWADWGRSGRRCGASGGGEGWRERGGLRSTDAGERWRGRSNISSSFVSGWRGRKRKQLERERERKEEAEWGGVQLYRFALWFSLSSLC